MISGIFNIFIFIMLLIISFIDIKTMTIPDGLLITCFLVSLISLILLNKITMNNIIGCAIGFVTFLIIALITNAMGGGDIKLIALLGFVFETKGIFFIIFFSFILGAIISLFLIVFKIKEKTDSIAFAPFISLATLIYIYFGN